MRISDWSSDVCSSDLGLFLGEDHVVAEVVDARAAELLGDVEAEQTGLASLEPQVARHDAVLLPLVVVRGDLLLEEGACALAEGFVLGVEDLAGGAHCWWLLRGFHG